MRFSVVIPVFNEADNILLLLEEIDAVFAAESAYEIIVVDDGSDDATADRLSQARGMYPVLRVLHHASRCGQSAALVSGVTAAKGEIIITLDGDGQNDPAEIPGLLQRYEKESGGRLMLAGQRVNRQDSLVTRWSSRLANTVRRAVLADATPDTGCGLKLFPRDLFLAMPVFNHMHRFLPALAQRAGARTLSVASTNRPRKYGQSKYGIHNRLWVGVIDLLGVAWLKRRRMQPDVTELK
jgi:dolichol-phosphate mannosyltransferase